MALAWEGFLNDVRAGDVGGTFEYFDTEGQCVIIRESDAALISTYGAIDEGQWLDIAWGSNLRVGNFGLSQFVPRHEYNGEVWAVGITPETVPASDGRFPTPEHPVGLYLYRYRYYQDLTSILDQLDTSEQSENQIKDAGFTIKNIGEEELNKTSGMFASGSRIVVKLGMGDSEKIPLSTVYIDEITWNKASSSMSISGRNAIGYYLSEQTFDEQTEYEGTRESVVNDILIYSGVNMTQVHIEEDQTVSSPEFAPTDTLLTGLNKIIDIWGWRITELPDGRIIIGSPTFHEYFYDVGLHEFAKDEAIARAITQRADGAYSRIAVQSNIAKVEGPPVVEEHTLTVYKDISYFDGWNIGNKRTLYIKALDNQTEEALEDLAEEYAKAYQYIGVNATRQIPIHPEIQAGDVIEIVDANTEEYVQRGIVTNVKHQINVASGTAQTLVSIDSGGTIEIGETVQTYTAANVKGDTRKRELIDVIRKAAEQEAKKKKDG